MIRHVSAAAVAFGLIASAAPAAHAATVPPARWHIVYQTDTANVTSLYGITAPSSTDAWAVGYTSYGNGSSRPSFVHWNGKRWQSVVIPDTASFRPLVAESTAPGDVWFFGEVQSSFEALHLVDGSWQLIAAPGNISTGTIAVLGNDDVWMLGLGGGCNESTGRCTSQLLHWNGQVWASSTIGTLIEGVAGWGSHVWAIGLTGRNVASKSTGDTVVYQFADDGWHKFASPQPATEVPPMLAATPSGQFWMLAPPLPGKPWVVNRWTGKRWTQLIVPSRLDGAVQMGPPMTYDGRSGIWLGPFLHWTGASWVDALEANPFPSLSGFGFQAIAPVPSSGSLWAAGVDSLGQLIAVYGRQP